MKPIRIRYARRAFHAARDAAGVPHIAAGSWIDALYGLGYLHAVDRLTQMLFSRVIAGGRATERIADTPELRETDRFFRRVGLYRNIEREIERLDDGVIEQLEAYCGGVNDGQKQAGRSLPMWATRFYPKHWDPPSVLLAANLLSFGGLAVGQQQNERILLELIHAGVDDDLLREMFEPLLDHADFDLLRRVRISSRLSDDALELITDLPRLAGSNAWAVSPARSATGGALLAADPHLEINRLPAIWYEAVIDWGDNYVMGATLPGTPVIGVARTRQLAWGVTYLKADTSDYFIEDCRGGGDTGWQYRRGNAWHDFERIDEQIEVKGGEPETLRVYRNPQGVLEVDPEETGDGLYLSNLWVGDHEGAGRGLETWLDVIHCRDTRSAMETVRESSLPTLVWVFADRDGHIGRQASGWVPHRRPGHTGAVPVPAWEDRNHWQGILPPHVMPQVYDPPEGFVASANENINPPDGPQLVTLPVTDYRKRRIVERLRELPEATLDDMQQLQYDVLSLQARDLLGVLLPHLPDGEVKERLGNWDCRYEPESTEATLFARLYRNVLIEVFGHHPGGIGWRRTMYLISRVGFSMMVVTAIDRVLRQKASLWWQGRNFTELMRRAAAPLADEPEQPWSVTNAFVVSSRFFPAQMLSRALGFHTGELPMRGCHATPFQGHLIRAAKRETTFAPSYHFVADLGTDEAWTNLPGGPSESRFSRYYKNDLALWLDGRYKRLSIDGE